MKFGLFLIFLLEILRTTAVLDKPGVTTGSLHSFLHSSANITYFEPVSYDKDSILKQHNTAIQNPADNAVVIELNAFQRYFSLILMQEINLFSQGLEVKIKSQGEEEANVEFKFNEFYTGIVSGDQSSYVTGRIRNDGTFDGCFYTAGTLYHLEPASRYFIHPLPFHSLVYQSQDVEFNSSLRIAASKVQHSDRKIHQLPKTMPFKNSNRRKREVKLSDNSTDINTCTLHIAADHRFYNHVGRGSVDETIAEMVFHIAGVDKIFRSTDFNGDGGPGDNIGFTIAAVTVYQDAAAEGILATASSTVVNFLYKWSTFDHDQYCVALLFTYQNFPKDTLGLAWVGSTEVGGICSKRVLLEDSDLGEMNFNTGFVSFLNRGVRIPRKSSLITTAHELGHSFGSEHDPSAEECSSEKLAIGGHYIMYTFSSSGRQPNNYLFSGCSKSQMWPVIFEKGPKCFVADNNGIFCGNRIVEEGEECDCGLPHECDLIDDCCEPGNKTLGIPGCRLKDGYQCSPRKGPCCTQDCMYITVPNKVCQEESECIYEVYCNSYNVTCPPAVSKPWNTTCNAGRNTCLDGQCIGSICTAYGLEECQCASHHLMCHVCCNDTKNGCVPASTMAGHQVISRPAGSMCNHDTGYCDQQAYCITVDTDNQFRRFKEAFDRTLSQASFNRATLWLRGNWYYIVVLIVGACLVTAWLKFTPFRHNPLERLMRGLLIRPYQHMHSATNNRRRRRGQRGNERIVSTLI